MDWPHDPDAEEGSEGMRKYGQAILAKKVDEEEDFPLSKAEFRERVGDHPVRIDHETVVSVADVLADVETEEFEDIQSFNQAMGRALRKQGNWPYETGSATSD
ncbi:DUF5785 family protein [Halocatena salina]|uniref:DUF5785 family protein n=1 Tax=Halocatena salina TaxID=2934340 RepID=A0A8U0A6Y0_9EURY|nr:DUF5785 family protein [Halocatena salina]UPM43713.1 DUF5785 family protein [Halocatena salina]